MGHSQSRQWLSKSVIVSFDLSIPTLWPAWFHTVTRCPQPQFSRPSSNQDHAAGSCPGIGVNLVSTAAGVNRNSRHRITLPSTPQQHSCLCCPEPLWVPAQQGGGGGASRPLPALVPDPPASRWPSRPRCGSCTTELGVDHRNGCIVCYTAVAPCKPVQCTRKMGVHHSNMCSAPQNCSLHQTHSPTHPLLNNRIISCRLCWQFHGSSTLGLCAKGNTTSSQLATNHPSMPLIPPQPQPFPRPLLTSTATLRPGFACHVCCTEDVTPKSGFKTTTCAKQWRFLQPILGSRVSAIF